MIKKYSIKVLVMTMKDDEDFQNYIKCWICGNAYVDDNFKGRGHYHITGKYIDSVDRDCKINVNEIMKFMSCFTT